MPKTLEKDPKDKEIKEVKEIKENKNTEVYDKTDLHNHILTRPDSYIGSISSIRETMYVPEENEEGDIKMVYKQIEYVQGLYKIVDEVIVNARDQYVRLNTSLDEPVSKKSKDIPVSNIWINVNQEKGYISVKNDGNGIPIRKHQTEDLYIPDMIFGYLLTSSNYKEGVRRFVGGKNGYGAKLANIYSTEFMIETVDHFHKKKYTQIYRDNMKVSEPPVIIDNHSQEPYTIIKFYPDFKRFKIQGITDDFLQMIKARAYDIAGCTDKKVNVFFNNCLIRVADFEDYVMLHFPSDTSDTSDGNDSKESKDKKDSKREIIYKKFSTNWEVAISPNFSTELTGKQISFVNGARTIKGGRHIQHVFNQLYTGINERLAKKKIDPLKESVLRYNMMIFVNCTIDSPEFSGQIKEELTTQIRDLYPKCDIDSKFIDEVFKTSIIDNAIKFGKATEEISAPKTKIDRRTIISSIPKLEDANDADSKHWQECVLIITEGDSAKSMVMKAIPNRDRYGVFPIRGKLLNVSEATAQQLKTNEEIANIRQILGIAGKKYVEGQKLRYGRIMIMTDQDLDGAHIKGLVLNYLKSLGLDKFEGFSSCFVTPIVKAIKGGKHKAFYSSQEFDKWLAQNDGGKGYKVKYYKGLGTSVDKEAREYFSQITDHLTCYEWDDKADSSLELAFSKNRILDRKDWLRNYDPNAEPDFSSKVPITSFINKEFIHFSNYDNVRSISCMCDGLKPSQRKVLFCAFEKRNLKTDLKVAQFGAAVAETTGYHHGEVSLFGTIVNMAQDFIGSNNINLFKPIGQFGSRMGNGSDHGAPRYIFTKLSDITQIIYNPMDTKLLNKLKDDDGNMIEPDWYCPIVPMCLINGTIGIGTGFSTGIPPFNPEDIVKNIRLMMKDEPIEELVPWFRGFTRNQAIKKIGENRYIIKGRYSADTNDDTLHITELPIGISTDSYKEFLSSFLAIKPKKDKEKSPTRRSGSSQYKIKDFRNNSAGNKIDFTIFFEKDTLCQYMVDSAVADKDGLTIFEKNLKLGTTLSFPGKMVLRDRDGSLMVYSSINDILKDFYSVRLEFYKKRHAMLLKDYKEEAELVNVKAKFVNYVIEGKIILFDTNKKKSRSKEEVSEQLVQLGFPKMIDKVLVPLDEIKEADKESADYEFLLSMRLSSLTREKIEELMAELKELTDKYKTLKGKTCYDLWEEDLIAFETQYNKDMKEYEAELVKEFAWGTENATASGKSKSKAKSTTASTSTTKSVSKSPKSSSATSTAKNASKSKLTMIDFDEEEAKEEAKEAKEDTDEDEEDIKPIIVKKKKTVKSETSSESTNSNNSNDSNDVKEVKEKKEVKKKTSKV
jgi:DNA topoisomerase-2